MNNQALIPSNAIVFNHNQVRTNSLRVAEAFGKRHDNVLRKLQTIECSADFTALNFEVSEFMDSTGRKLPMWEMTKDGFIFLVMGFTGSKAAQVKEAYINAFNAMADELSRRQAKPQPTTLESIKEELNLLSIPDKLKVLAMVKELAGEKPSTISLTPAQQRHIQARVYFLANQPGSSYPSVWRSVKDRFNVGSYKDIPAKRFPELCKYLGAPIPPQLELEGELLERSVGALEQVTHANYPSQGKEFTYGYAELQNICGNSQLDKFLAILEQHQGQRLALSVDDVSGLRKELRSMQYLNESLALRLERARDAANYAASQLKGPF